MKQIGNSRYYTADNGKIFKRKRNNKYFGQKIFLSINDSIDNFKEVKLTKNNDVEGLLKK